MKKHFVYKVAVLLLCTALLTGCGQKDKAALPEDFSIDFVFSSGAGAWATSMTLEQDGTFSGAYYDADMGVYDEDYPNGTVYIYRGRGLGIMSRRVPCRRNRKMAAANTCSL